MTKYLALLPLVFPLVLSGCNTPASKQASNSSGNTAECIPYFTYDQVEHYSFNMSEAEIIDMEAKEKKSDKEVNQLELLLRYTPDTLSDTIILKDIEKIGFIKHDVPKNKIEQLNTIFCERKHKVIEMAACGAIYRDVLIFKENNKIVGIAKICFGCFQNVITGTARDTEGFGQSGDYERLYRLLYSKSIAEEKAYN